MPGCIVLVCSSVRSDRIANHTAAAERLNPPHDDLTTGIEGQAMLADGGTVRIIVFCVGLDRPEGRTSCELALCHAELALEADDSAQLLGVEFEVESP